MIQFGPQQRTDHSILGGALRDIYIEKANERANQVASRKAYGDYMMNLYGNSPATFYAADKAAATQYFRDLGYNDNQISTIVSKEGWSNYDRAADARAFYQASPQRAQGSLNPSPNFVLPQHQESAVVPGPAPVDPTPLPPPPIDPNPVPGGQQVSRDNTPQYTDYQRDRYPGNKRGNIYNPGVDPTGLWGVAKHLTFVDDLYNGISQGLTSNIPRDAGTSPQNTVEGTSPEGRLPVLPEKVLDFLNTSGVQHFLNWKNQGYPGLSETIAKLPTAEEQDKAFTDFFRKVSFLDNIIEGTGNALSNISPRGAGRGPERELDPNTVAGRSNTRVENELDKTGIEYYLENKDNIRQGVENLGRNLLPPSSIFPESSQRQDNLVQRLLSGQSLFDSYAQEGVNLETPEGKQTWLQDLGTGIENFFTSIFQWKPPQQNYNRGGK